MAKIILNDVNNINSVTTINDNFDKIEDALQDGVLWRDNPTGENNVIEQDIDLNGFRLINVGDILPGYGSFPGMYLGDFPSDPVVDNSGNALETGMLYFYTGTPFKLMRVYNGASWQDVGSFTNNVVNSIDPVLYATSPEAGAGINTTKVITPSTAKVAVDVLRNDLLSVASNSLGTGAIAWKKQATGSQTTSLYKYIDRQDIDVFDFLTDAQIADVEAGTSLLDVSAGVQAAINAANGRPIRVRAGKYRINTALSYNTSGTSPGLKLIGDGSGKTIFDNRVASNAMLSLNGSGTPNQYAIGTKLEGFTILSGAVVASSVGIDLRSQWWMTWNDIVIDGLSSHNVRLTNDNSDSDASAYWEIKNSNFKNSTGGWGFFMPNPTLGTIATTSIVFDNVQVTGNSLGGIRHFGLQWKIKGGSISYNTGSGGLVVPYIPVATPASNLIVDATEFDNNSNYQIDLQAIKGADLKNLKITYRANGVGIRIGDNGAAPATNVKAEGNTHNRVSGTITAHSIGSNGSFSRIISSYYPTLANVTKIVDSGVSTEEFQDGKWAKSAIATNTFTGATSYSPNISSGPYHRIVVNATGSFNLDPPTSFGDGLELIIDLFNASGGTINVSFDPSYLVGGFVNPANNKRRTARFIYHLISSKWIQIGDWSQDL